MAFKIWWNPMAGVETANTKVHTKPVLFFDNKIQPRRIDSGLQCCEYIEIDMFHHIAARI